MSTAAAPGLPELHCRLLGPPQLTWQGAPLLIPRRQARALLYRLAADLQPHSREQLAYLFWPDVPDATARRNLVRLLSYLRGVLPDPDCLLVAGGSLQLDAARVWSDAAALAALSPDAETGVLARAVEDYRERFLAGFYLPDAAEFDHWQAQTATRLERRYLALLRTLIERESAAAPARAMAYARRYLAVDELAEAVHRQLITLYGNHGDREAAARQFEQCSLVLERELGVSPLPATRAAYEAALAGGAAEAAATIMEPALPRWSVLPSLELPLLGREEALRQLQDAGDRLAAGGFILLSGEPGVGKSRLLQAFALSGDRRVLIGNSHRATHHTPYQPLVEALRGALAEPAARHAIGRALRPIRLAEVARLLPEVNEQFPHLPQPLTVEPEQAQTRLFDALTACFSAIAADRPLLLCLDDLHWADPATLGWLVSLAGGPAQASFPVLATARSTNLAALADVRRAFRRRDQLVEFTVTGLDQAAIRTALDAAGLAISAGAAAELTQALARATGGNAFFLLETLRAVQERDTPVETLAALPIATTVQDAIQARLNRLSDLAQQVVRAAAVLAPHLRPELLAQTAGRSDLELADALDELTSRQLLRHAGDVFQFAHDLVRAVAYDGLTPWRRRILHRRCAASIHAQATAEPALLNAMAQHYEEAGAFAEALAGYRHAAEAAEAVYAYEEAAALLGRALKLAPDAGISPKETVALHRALGRDLAVLGRFEEARAAYQAGLALCPPEESVLRARLYGLIGKTYLTLLHYPQAVHFLEQALAILAEAPRGEASPGDISPGDISPGEEASTEQLWLDIQLDRLYYFMIHQEAQAFAALEAEILPVLERAGTPAQRGHFARLQRYVVMERRRFRPPPELIAYFREELRRAEAADDPPALAGHRFDLGYFLLHAGDLAAACDMLSAALSGHTELADRMGEARCLAFLSTCYRLLGDRQRTADYARRAEVASLAVGSRHYHAHSLASQAWLAYRDGRAEQALALAQEASTAFIETYVPFGWPAHLLVLALHAARGAPEPAIAAAELMLRPDQQRLPEPLEPMLAQALALWAAGAPVEAVTALQAAVEMAREIGCL